jgi:hypothetical protein
VSTSRVATPASRVRFGLGRADITPPVGIYQGLWGAAKHDRSTGIHRRLSAEVLAFQRADGADQPMLRAELDQSMWSSEEFDRLRRALSEASGVPTDRIEITISHTHAAGRFLPDRLHLPGGDLIIPFLRETGEKLRTACQQAVADLREVTITYATGRCNLAANRDYWDEANGLYACGFNPDAPADDTLIVARLVEGSGQQVATIVNYACHPTTLAFENSLLSPDYVGTTREEIERVTGTPCVFLLGACGDLGPRDGYTGNVDLAERNGRQVAYAALSALASLGPPSTDFVYQGPVISGATLGTWAHVPYTPDRLAQVSRFSGGAATVSVPVKQKPDQAALKADMEQWLIRQRDAEVRGATTEAQAARAYAERLRRYLHRLEGFPTDTTYALHVSVYRMGDAIWVTCGGEPYNLLQRELRQRFPDYAILVSPLAGDPQVSYLLSAGMYGQGVYQEEASPLAPGCLEIVVEAVSAKIKDLMD